MDETAEPVRPRIRPNQGAPKQAEQAEVKPQVLEVSDAEVEAALQELLHERNSIGDGCFGCGDGRLWGPHIIATNRHRYQEMLKRILEAARPHQK